jgi:hypothetical protein
MSPLPNAAEAGPDDTVRMPSVNEEEGLEMALDKP